MLRVLITGVSGVGKSTVVARLGELGYKAVDTDFGGWCAPTADGEALQETAEPGWVWREGRIRELLDAADAEVLFVSGCVPNQGVFYRDFDHVVLLSAPAETVRHRLLTRTGNPYGKTPEQLEAALRDQREVEPLLRSGATVEIDTRAPVDEVVARLVALVGGQ
ncbi:AAA family ATPase [Glycomyces mayteni]|uniref:AAA family ATPase n=1 Tax=Glycomyces mayteni TaxID=543887 RepID=A0ABW2D4Y3_9ACTN|nr:AAA family ATPase [Glycomyces mayteni]